MLNEPSLAEILRQIADRQTEMQAETLKALSMVITMQAEMFKNNSTAITIIGRHDELIADLQRRIDEIEQGRNSQP